VVIEGIEGQLKVFGNHNLLNMHASWLVCKQIGVSAKDFINSIGDFTGAAKRLELLARNEKAVVYRDFAHAPSKVRATINAVRSQFPSKKLIAVLELHTYSSLNEQFMKEYSGVLDIADEAAVFYSKHALELKRMPPLPKDVVQNGFGNQSLQVFEQKDALENWLNSLNYDDCVVLLMSSGNYEGMDVDRFAKRITL
jgi:UDP-N-acetylmuramate: L-alanyl-gamma-D-glutamyl-meso-diaminopimelate ligase